MPVCLLGHALRNLSKGFVVGYSCADRRPSIASSSRRNDERLMLERLTRWQEARRHEAHGKPRSHAQHWRHGARHHWHAHWQGPWHGRHGACTIIPGIPTWWPAKWSSLLQQKSAQASHHCAASRASSDRPPTFNATQQSQQPSERRHRAPETTK